MDKSAIDTPSREATFPSTCALPSGGRWSLKGTDNIRVVIHAKVGGLSLRVLMKL